MTHSTADSARFILRHLVYLLVCIPGAGSGNCFSATDPWGVYRDLVGLWNAETPAGRSDQAGSFSFAFDLQEHILVRKNHLEMGKGDSHDDLLIMYWGDSSSVRAIYFDNEGHTIRYGVTATDGGRVIEFLSDRMAGAPRFKLTYTKTGRDRYDIGFFIAPPGEPETFAPYMHGSAVRASVR